jgi:integrase
MEYSSELDKLNYGHKLKIRLKPGRKVRTVYLECYIDGARKREYLNLHITGNSLTDKQNLRVAAVKRDEMELQMLNEQSKLQIFDTKKPKSQDTFHAYALSVIEDKIHITRKFYESGINSFIAIAGEGLKLTAVTEKDIKQWIDSMTYTDTTRANYLRAVKYVLKHAVRAKLISYSPAENFHIKTPESSRGFLTVDEIQKIADVPFNRPAVQDAFLFSCFTGLRRADVLALKWSNIDNDYLAFTQQKTGQTERIKLAATAQAIINRQDRTNDRVFNLPSRKIFFCEVKRLMEEAGISKNATFHWARHTFATQLITNGSELLTVQKLLGHKDIRSTLVYAKLVDRLKDEAIDRLPVIKSLNIK